MGETGERTRRDKDYRPFETLGRVDGANGDFLKRCKVSDGNDELVGVSWACAVERQATHG